jgi:hypothetical protein
VLEAMVRRLSTQVEGLQEAMRQRAVIEQAKGVLVAREGCSAEEAFGTLVRSSQHRNVKVARVAAEVVATVGPLPAASAPAAPAVPCSPSRCAVPDPAGSSAAPASAEDERAWREAYPLALAAVEAAASPAELAEAVRRFPAERAPDHVLVTALEPDGSLALVGSAGLEPRAASVWRRIPAVVDLPVTVAARFGAPVWCPDAEEMRSRFPGVAHLVPLRADPDGDVVGAERRIAGVDQTAAPPAVAALPLTRAGAVHGVLAIGWVGERSFPEALRSHLTALADAVARRLEDLQAPHVDAGAAVGDVVPAGPALAAVTIALQTVLDPALLLSPVRGGDGVVDDFRVDWANSAALAAVGALRHRYVGLTLREVTPAAVREHLLGPYRQVLATGQPALLPAVSFLPDTGDRRTGPTVAISVARLFDGLVVSWRAHR